MQYAFLFYESVGDMSARTGADAAAYWGGWGAYHQALVDANAVTGGSILDTSDTSSTVRVRDERQSVQDGPFADSKEELGGFMLIEAANLDAALEWAARCPAAATGAVEVRPIMPIDEPGEGASPSDEEPSKPTHALLLFDAEDPGDASAEEQEQVFAQYMAYTEALVEAGAMRGGEALEPSHTATTVRLRDGQRLVQDGPYADSKEQLGGYYLLAVSSAEEAAAWAAKCPAASTGAVEVRPTGTMPDM